MNKYLDHVRYAHRIRGSFNRRALAAIERFLVTDGDAALPFPPIFILGAPRSGSTLFVQAMTNALDVGYISNRHCPWFGAPALAEYVFRPTRSRVPSDYKSQHGVTTGSSAPAECGEWWYRFFRRAPAYVTRDDVSDNKMRAFRYSLHSLESVMQRPLVFKNLYASLRIDPIAQHVPNALFIVVERDVVDNAQSILKGRMDALGSYELWWSVPPPDVAELQKLKPVQQAVEQVRSIRSLIRHDVERLGLESQTLHVNYDDFCRDVPTTLEAIRQFASKNGITLESRFEVPTSFKSSKSRKVPENMYEELVAYVRQTEEASADRVECN